MDLINVPCKTNSDCAIYTGCCSMGQCTQGAYCYNGNKAMNDYCDFKYECMTNCCSSNTCQPIFGCTLTCQRNSDCGTNRKCSFGFCAGLNFSGRKVNTDNCERNSECASNYCLMGNATHPINIARLDSEGVVRLEPYTGSDLG